MRNSNRHLPYNSTDNSQLIHTLQSIKLEEWQEVKDVGPVVARSIYEFFQEKKNLELIEKLLKVGVTIEEPKRLAISHLPLANKTFVFTGGLETLTRDEAKDKVRQLGGDVSESVSKETDYVVVGSEPGSKYDEAKRLGVKMISEKEFLQMV